MSAPESGPRLVLTDAATPEDELVIRDGLGAYNFRKRAIAIISRWPCWSPIP